MSYAPEAAPQRGWFGRNWLWFVPLMLLLLAVVACGGCGVAVYLFQDQFVDLGMPEVPQALTLMRDNAEVREALGEPIERVGMPTPTRQDFKGQSISRTIAFEAKGPKGSAGVEVEADIMNNAATITRLQVTLPDGKQIDLTPAGGAHEATTEGESTVTSGDAPAETSGDEAETTGSTETETEAAPTP